MIIHNLFVLSAGNPRTVDSTGDGTGHSLTVSKHYRTEREADLKDEIDTSVTRKEYLFTVAILDLDTNLYIGYAAGFESEKALFLEAKEMLLQAGFRLASIRLDKYYSYQSIVNEFGEETRIYLIPNPMPPFMDLKSGNAFSKVSLRIHCIISLSTTNEKKASQ